LCVLETHRGPKKNKHLTCLQHYQIFSTIPAEPSQLAHTQTNPFVKNKTKNFYTEFWRIIQKAFMSFPIYTT